MIVKMNPEEEHNVKYILGVLNSKLISFWFVNIFGKLQRKIFPQFKIKELSQFPIPVIKFSDPKDKARHDRMVSLVQTILDLNNQLAKAKTSHEKTALKRQIDTTDQQIDNLVYELYHLTDKEITIVEGG